MAFDQLFCGDWKQIAINQTGNIKKDFTNRERIYLEREAACRPYTALDSFGKLTKMHMTRIGFRPRIDDTDDRQHENNDRHQTQTDFDRKSGKSREIFAGRCFFIQRNGEIFRSGAVEGQQEEEDNLVSVRSRFAGDEGQMALDAFIDMICKEIRTKERREVVNEA